MRRSRRELLTTWGLPETVCDAVGAHHGEGLDALPGGSRKLADVVFHAVEVADLFCRETKPDRLADVQGALRGGGWP